MYIEQEPLSTVDSICNPFPSKLEAVELAGDLSSAILIQDQGRDTPECYCHDMRMRAKHIPCMCGILYLRSYCSCIYSTYCSGI